jgi:signal transduction histidine kinase
MDGGVQESDFGPVHLAVERLGSGIAVALRAGGTAIGCVAAVAGTADGVAPAWLVPSVVVLAAWAVVFTLRTRRAGLSRTLVGVDLVLAATVCLAQTTLVPAAALMAGGGTGWVVLIASPAVFIAQIGWPPMAGVAGAGLLAGAYYLGAPSPTDIPFVLLLQGVLAQGVIGLLRRAGRAADHTVAARTAAHVEAATRAALRADERDQHRRLHDTVLATITMIGADAIAETSPAVRARIRADLAVLAQLGAAPGGTAAASARLDLTLRAVDRTPLPGLPPLRVVFDAPPIELPRPVVAGIAGSVAEALTNVARHAGTDVVRVCARRNGDGVVVEVVDAGRGFDLGATLAHRRGVRDSIINRVREVGGDAEILACPGAGTRVVLRWPR